MKMKKRRLTFARGTHKVTKEDHTLIASVQGDGWIDVNNPENVYPYTEIDLKPLSIHTYEETYTKRALELKKLNDKI